MAEITRGNDKRDIGVELLRIIGCLSVIAIHIKLSNTSNGILDTNRIFISAVLADGVNIFWIILGFFLLTEEIPYTKRINKALKRVVLPLFLYNAFTFYFSDYIFNGQTLLESIQHSWADYKYVLCEGILKWKDAFPYAGHLWFMYIYFAVIVCRPALQGIAKIILKSDKSRMIGLLILYGLLVINDISANGLLGLSYFSVGGIAGASFYVLLGSLIYQYREKIRGSIKYGVAGFVIFILACVARTLIRYYLCADDAILLWYSSFGVPTMIGLCFMIFGFGGLVEWKGLLRKVVLHLGKISTYVYFFHAFSIYFCLNRNILAGLEGKLARSWYGDILYTIVAMFLIAAMTLIISEVVYLLHCLLKRCIKNKAKIEQVG